MKHHKDFTSAMQLSVTVPCISGWFIMKIRPHLRVVDVVSVPARKRSAVDISRFSS